MAADWDPDAPGTIGLPWFPNSIVDRAPTQGRAVAMTVPSTAAETVAGAYVGIGSVSQAGLACVDVYASSAVVAGSVTTASFVPNSDITVGSGWENQGGATTNLYQSIDNGTVSPSTYITYLGPYSAANRYEPGYGTAAWPAARRVIGGRFVFAADVQENTGRIQVWYSDNGTRVLLGTCSLTTTTQSFSVEFGELNPVTGLPWTEADIENLDTTDSFGFRPLSGAAIQIRVYDVRLDIDYVTEDRVAAGVLALTPTSDLTWETFSLINPNSGAANWSKSNSTDYTVVVRAPTPVGGITAAQFTVRTLDSGLPLPTGSVGYLPTLGNGGRVLDLDDARTFGMSLAFDVNASATDSVDGMPYISYQVPTAAATGQTANGATATTYTLLRFYVAFVGTAAGEPSVEAVEWSISTTAPAVLDSGVLSASEIEATPYKDFPAVASVPSAFIRVYGPFEVPCSVTLAAATTYRLNVENPDTTATGVTLLTTQDAALTARGNPATYGGTTLDFSGEDYLDAPITLSTQPDAPTGFEAYAVERTIADQPSGCAPSTVETTRLQWDPTSLGADFERYEIWRSTDDGDTWQRIRAITDETVDRADTDDSPYNTTVAYRMRVIRAGDLIPSPWTDTQHAQVTLDECAYVLSSDLDPDLTVTLGRGPVATWNWPSAEEVSIVAPTGADYQTAVIRDEWRGTTFEVEAQVWNPGFTNVRPNVGEAMFDRLIALSRLDAPYVTVRDETGSVWYANITVTPGSRDATAEFYTANVFVAELTDTPAVFDQTSTVLGTASAWWDARVGTDSSQTLGDPTADLIDLTGNGYDLTPVLGTYGRPIRFTRKVEDEPVILFPGFTDEGISTPDPGAEGDYLEITWREQPNGINPSSNRAAAHQGDDTGNDAGWYVSRNTAGRPILAFSPDGTSAAVQIITATATPGQGTGLATFKAVFRDTSGGSEIVFYTQDPTLPSDAMRLPLSDPSWEQLGAATTSAFPATVHQSGTALVCSNADTIGGVQMEYNGILHRLLVTNSAGTIIADLNPADAVRPYDTIEGGASETWTCYRASSTNSTRVDVIDRACLTNGNNSAFTGGNIFNVGAADSLTAVVCLWEQSVTASLNGTIGKSVIDLNPTDEPTWGIGDITSIGDFNTIISDGGGAPGTGFVIEDMEPQPDEGEVTVVGMVIDRANADLIAYTDGQASTGGDISGIGSTVNPRDFLLGGFSNYGQASIVSAAVFTRALTAAQMESLVDEMSSLDPPGPSTVFTYEGD